MPPEQGPYPVSFVPREIFQDLSGDRAFVGSFVLAPSAQQKPATGTTSTRTVNAGLPPPNTTPRIGATSR